jgi:hypothetical protein
LKALRRIERRLGMPGLLHQMAEQLSVSDLTALLTVLFAERGALQNPADLIKRYARNAYAKPAGCSASDYRLLEAEMLMAAEERGAHSILLSPAALFGCCSAFGAVSQNKVISAARGLEFLSDATNMLALYIAAGLKNGTLSHADSPIHVCTTHRHIRYQAAFGTGMLPHFGLFTMVSAGRSRPSYAFEAEALLFHLRFYGDYWQKKHGAGLSLTFHIRKGYQDSAGFFERMVETVKAHIPGMAVHIDRQANDTVYYTGLQAKMHVCTDGGMIEIGDLGFTDWTQKLLNHKGERLLISAMALDRQMT